MMADRKNEKGKSSYTFEEIHVRWPAAWHWALKRRLNETSNRQELPRIGPIKLPPFRVYTRILTANFIDSN